MRIWFSAVSSAMLVVTAAGCSGAPLLESRDDLQAMSKDKGSTYATKTPYEPQQELDDYESPPKGFTPVFTELLARHGSRGLSGMKDDAAAYEMAKRASAERALQPRAATLPDDILRIMKANALLGAGVSGIKKPGYGNLTKIGIEEHEELAERLVERLPELFANVAASAGTAAPRTIEVISSGVDRAVDSASFFAKSLVEHAPGVTSLVTSPPAPSGYPAGAPVAQPAGTNRFLLYFHKLKAATDLVTDPADPFFRTYQQSLAYQAYSSDADLEAKLDAIVTSPEALSAARAVLERVFTKEFVAKIEGGTYTFANDGTFTFAGDDGAPVTLTGDGKTKITNLVEAATALYSLYQILPAMKEEAEDADFKPYFPSGQAAVFAAIADAQDFYEMGPGMTEKGAVTYGMAEALREDFFNEIDAIAKGDLSHGAKLRFAHAETVVPFTSSLGLKDVFVQLPKAEMYSHRNNPWRGEKVSPFAANIQWDVYGDGGGKLLVKMLHNEREIDFKAECDGARYSAKSRYYEYTKLKACYGHTAR